MHTYLLTWNPARWPWNELAEASQRTADGMPYSDYWSTGNTKKIAKGDRVFLLKQGESPRGIIAAGWVTSEKVYEAPHYDELRAAQGDIALRADVEFERILNPTDNPPLPVEQISDGPLADVSWHIPASGTEMPDAAAKELEGLWAGYVAAIDGTTYPRSDEAVEPLQESEFAPQEEDGREIVFQQIKDRRGQQIFRNSLRERYGESCLISGCTLMDVVEAAHIKPYRGNADNHPANGLLLRADLHTLFDLDLMGIEPTTLLVRVHPVAKAAGYAEFDGVQIKCLSAKPSEIALTIRWRSFLKKLEN